MTTPRSRISFGPHTFIFTGIEVRGEDRPPLPLLPIRLRLPSGYWTTPFNAILDTGSTRTILPTALARDLELEPTPDREEVQGAGGSFEVRPAKVDVRIVDSQFPDVACWELLEFTLWIPEAEVGITHLLLGWDLLSKFVVTLDHKAQRIEMRMVLP